MTPIDIGAHPDAPDHYIRLGKPADWSDDDCGSLAVRRVVATGDIFFEPAVRIVQSVLPSGETVYPAFLSEWVPSEEELVLLNAGQPLRVLVSGNGLPPMALHVRALDEL